MRHLLATLALVLIAMAPADADEPVTVYVAPTGSDTNPGTQTQPFATLGGASDWLCAQACDGLGKPVTVIVSPGAYLGAQGVWEYSDPTYRTHIIGDNTTFSGQNTVAYGLLIHPTNTPSNLTLEALTWTRFTKAGINQQGGGDDLYLSNQFIAIGSYHTKNPNNPAWGGILWSNVSGSTIQASLFERILNSYYGGYGKEHGIYLVRSTNNTISGNKFRDIGGDPIRVRDRSSRNIVTNNRFIRTGSRGYLTDWYCQPAKYDCPTNDEQRSWANQFVGNTVYGPHPWHNPRFYTVFCYDIPATATHPAGFCSQQRITR